MSSDTVAKSTSDSFGKIAGTYLDAITSSVPENFQTHIKKIRPVVVKVADQIEILIPILITYYNKFLELYAKLEPYHPELLVPSVIGLVMCFFGGSFMTLIAAVEAYKMVGWESSKQCLLDLKHDFQLVLDANAKDDAKDDDNDGIADVKQISPKELATRKMLLFLKTIDPHRFSKAIAGLQASFLAVLATLKIQFAKAITLGNSIADIVEAPALRYGVPVLNKFVPAEYKKWIEPLISYIVRSTAISIAWSIQRVISAFHSAIAGGVMAARNVIEYMNEMKWIEFDHTKSYLDEAAGYALAIVGLWFQLSMGFQLPFILKLFLFPFSIAEWILMYLVSRM